MKVMLVLFLVGLSWNGIVAPPPFPNMTLFLTTTLFVVVVMAAFVKIALGQKVMIQIDFPILVVCVLLPVSLMLPFIINQTGFGVGRLLLYAMPLIVYVAFVFALGVSRISLDWVLGMIAFGFFLTMVSVAVEFMARYFFSYEVFQFLPRTRGELSATVGLEGARFLRSAGFSTEPTIIAFYINSLAPISVYILFLSNHSALVKLAGLLATVVAALSTFSPAILSVVFVSTIMFLCRLFGSRPRLKRKQVTFGFSVFLALGALLFLGPSGFFSRPVNALRSYLDGFETGGSQRAVRVQDAISEFLSTTDTGILIFGRGTSAFTGEWLIRHGSSPNNAYLTILLELGIFGLIIFLAILFFPLLRLRRVSSPYALYIAIGLMAGAAHLMVVSIFFSPFFLALVPLACLIAASPVRAQRPLQGNSTLFPRVM